MKMKSSEPLLTSLNDLIKQNDVTALKDIINCDSDVIRMMLDPPPLLLALQHSPDDVMPLLLVTAGGCDVNVVTSRGVGTLHVSHYFYVQSI